MLLSLWHRENWGGSESDFHCRSPRWHVGDAQDVLPKHLSA